MRKVLGLVFLAILLMAASADLSARKNSEPDKGEKQKKIQAIVGEVKLRNLQTFPYCAVEMKGSYNQHQKAFHTLFAEANKQRVQMESAVFAVYYSDPQTTPEEDLIWEVGFAVSKGQKVSEPLKLKKWKFPKVAALVYEGEFEEEPMSKAYDKLDEWISSHGLKPIGPVMENYLSMPEKTESGKLMGRIEIMVPVEK